MTTQTQYADLEAVAQKYGWAFEAQPVSERGSHRDYVFRHNAKAGERGAIFIFDRRGAGSATFKVGFWRARTDGTLALVGAAAPDAAAELDARTFGQSCDPPVDLWGMGRRPRAEYAEAALRCFTWEGALLAIDKLYRSELHHALKAAAARQDILDAFRDAWGGWLPGAPPAKGE